MSLAAKERNGSRNSLVHVLRSLLFPRMYRRALETSITVFTSLTTSLGSTHFSASIVPNVLLVFALQTALACDACLVPAHKCPPSEPAFLPMWVHISLARRSYVARPSYHLLAASHVGIIRTHVKGLLCSSENLPTPTLSKWDGFSTD